MKNLLIYSTVGSGIVILSFISFLFAIKADMASINLFFITSFFVPLLVSLGVSFFSAKKAPLSLQGILIGVMAALLAYLVYYPTQVVLGNLEFVQLFMQELAAQSDSSSMSFQQSNGVSDHLQSFITGLIFVSFLGSIGGWLGEKKKSSRAIL